MMTSPLNDRTRLVAIWQISKIILLAMTYLASRLASTTRVTTHIKHHLEAFSHWNSNFGFTCVLSWNFGVLLRSRNGMSTHKKCKWVSTIWSRIYHWRISRTSQLEFNMVLTLWISIRQTKPCTTTTPN